MLHHRRAHRRPRGPEPADGVDDVVGGPEVLGPQGIRDAGLAEQLPAAALRPQVEVPGIGAVHGNAEPNRQVPLELGGVVGHQVGPVLVRDEIPDLGQEPRALEDLERQRPQRAVVGHRVEESRPRVGRNDSRQEPEVVVHHVGQDRPRRDVDHARARLPEQEEHEQEALLHGLEHGRRHVQGVERDRRHDDDRLGVPVQAGDRLPEGDQLVLEGRVADPDLLRRETERRRRARILLGAHAFPILVAWGSSKKCRPGGAAADTRYHASRSSWFVVPAPRRGRPAVHAPSRREALVLLA